MTGLFKRNKLLQPSGIYVDESPIHGCGVFAKETLDAGSVVEKAPLLLINQVDKELLKNTVLYHYYFLLNNAEHPAAVGLGYSSLYNHSTPSNAIYSIDLAKKIIEIKTVKVIAAGEEITLNYNGQPGDMTPVAFSSLTV